MVYGVCSDAQTYNLNGTISGTTINTCSGNFYDSGGNNGRYQNNESYNVTFCSDNGDNIVFDFQFWNVENHATCNYDYLSIKLTSLEYQKMSSQK